MYKSRVAILKTRPDTVTQDYARLLELANCAGCLDPDAETLLKINISWQHFFPGCSTTPWQLDGVIQALLESGFCRGQLSACHNRTVVVSAKKGEVENAHLPVVKQHDIRNVHLYEEKEEWVHIESAIGDVMDRLLALNKIYPDGFHIPRRLIGANIIQLPTVKTHVFTTITGAMKNAFGGLLNEKRHWAHEAIHEALVDLLMIQQKIHPGLFAVMDGTFAGDGPGPRCMEPQIKNVILASADQVAIDAVAARLMGFDPLEDIKFIRIAHELGLGCGDTSEIEIVGDTEAARENWHFQGPHRNMTFAARMQHAIYWGPLRSLLHWTLKSPLAFWSYLASIFYHDFYWYPLIGRPKVARMLQTGWGRLLQDYRKRPPVKSRNRATNHEMPQD
ncbi:MAG: DUF362 domain-containing protein [Planctomycetes bacterium]|nr:DUF362 domain-containing protein [Planctomycetota bacterium]